MKPNANRTDAPPVDEMAEFLYAEHLREMAEDEPPTHYARQLWQALDVYEDRGEIDERTIAQARECLERACYEWDVFVEGVVCAWLVVHGGKS